MKSGLYACAGASATASAAACAKRFKEPMTNESKVYFGLRPLSLCLRGGAAEVAAVSRGWSATVRRIRRSWPVASRAAAEIKPRKCPSIHSRVKSFGTEIASVSSVSSTPSASANHVRYVVSLRAPLSRPATSDHRLCAVSSTWRLTRLDPLLPSPPGEAEHTNLRLWLTTTGGNKKARSLQAFPETHNSIPRCGETFTASVRMSGLRHLGVGRRCGQRSPQGLLYTGRRAFAPLSPSSRHTPHLEADLPAERASPEAPARLPRADVDTRGARDPQAAARERAQAPLRLTRPLGSRIDVERRHRLSRSRDFDAVYRHGRSVSTRFLVLYSFARDDDGPPRIGFAIPKGTGSAVVRNRVKRQLREAWRARLAEIPGGRDYVLIARPGLAEAAEARGFEWLGGRIGEGLGEGGS